MTFELHTWSGAVYRHKPAEGLDIHTEDELIVYMEAQWRDWIQVEAHGVYSMLRWDSVFRVERTGQTVRF